MEELPFEAGEGLLALMEGPKGLGLSLLPLLLVYVGVIGEGVRGRREGPKGVGGVVVGVVAAGG